MCKIFYFFATLFNYITNNIPTVIAGIFSFVVFIFSYRITSQQKDIALKQYTLSYIEMENNDFELQQARKWLHNDDAPNITKTNDFIASFSSWDNFKKYRKYPEITEELIEEFKEGNDFINKIIISRLVASETIISGMLDEKTYWLIRNHEFQKDYLKLEKFMIEKFNLKNKDAAFNRQAFRIVVKKWQEENIAEVKKNMEKEQWAKYFDKEKWERME